MLKIQRSYANHSSLSRRTNLATSNKPKLRNLAATGRSANHCATQIQARAPVVGSKEDLLESVHLLAWPQQLAYQHAGRSEREREPNQYGSSTRTHHWLPVGANKESPRDKQAPRENLHVRAS